MFLYSEFLQIVLYPEKVGHHHLPTYHTHPGLSIYVFFPVMSFIVRRVKVFISINIISLNSDIQTKHMLLRSTNFILKLFPAMVLDILPKIYILT
jgi:hypothetical protein